MPSLQIRDLPEPLHRLLQRRAREHNAASASRPSPIWSAAPAELIRQDRQR